MIRLRIERKTIDFTPEGNGLCWFEDGEIVGRVIIEQAEFKMSPVFGVQPEEWVPVEVIDEV